MDQIGNTAFGQQNCHAVDRAVHIERLRHLALLQKSQLEGLLAMLARKCAELQKLKGGGDELQLTLKLLEGTRRSMSPK